ncbi:MAG: hypothetical protein ACRDRW_00660 [Pseudonocardiaceae bacterium]
MKPTHENGSSSIKKAIAEILGLETRTIDMRITVIFRKLGIPDLPALDKRNRRIHEIGSWPPWRPAEQRHTGARPPGGEALLSGRTDPVRVSPGSRDISVDSLAAELVIDRRLAHGATP